MPVALVNTMLLKSEFDALILVAINCEAVAFPIIAPEILATAAVRLVVLTVVKEPFVADKSAVIMLPKLPVVDCNNVELTLPNTVRFEKTGLAVGSLTVVSERQPSGP